MHDHRYEGFWLNGSVRKGGVHTSQYSNKDDQLFFTTNGKSSSYPFLHKLQAAQDRANQKKRNARAASRSAEVRRRNELERTFQKRWKRVFKGVVAQMRSAANGRDFAKEARIDEQDASNAAHYKKVRDDFLRRKQQGRARAVEVVRRAPCIFSSSTLARLHSPICLFNVRMSPGACCHL